MSKDDIYQKELQKLEKIFETVEKEKKQLVEGLIQDAAFLLAENAVLKESISVTGMVRFHPQHPDIQKSTEAGKQYLRNINSYAVIIKTLNGVLMKAIIEDEDELAEFQ